MAIRSVARSCLQLSSTLPSSAVASFIQLAPRRCLHSPATPILDFLAPRLQSSSAKARRPARQYGVASGSKGPEGRRGFTMTSRRLETRAILHAAKDGEGNDMSLDITPRAAKRLKEIMTKDSNPNLALRIQVESGGCHGFQYLLSLSTIPPLLPSSSADINATLSESAIPETHQKAEEAAKLDEEDVVFEDFESKARVVIDVPSLELLNGSKVEYTTGLIGSQFSVINPNSSSNCGCGTSFDIKI